MLHPVFPGKLMTVSGEMSSSSQRKPWDWRVPVHSSMFFYTPIEAVQTQTHYQHDHHLLLYISTSFRIEESDPLPIHDCELELELQDDPFRKSTH